MSIELVNRISYERKVKRNLRTSNRWPHLVTNTCFQGRLRDVLRTSWRSPKSNSQGCLLDVRLGRPLDVISRRSQGVRSRRPRDSQIGSLEDVLGTLEEDVLGTFSGPIFAGWVCSIGFLTKKTELMEHKWRAIPKNYPNQWLRSSKEEVSMLGLKIIFGYHEMGSLPSKNWAIKYLLCVIIVFTNYAWVKSLKEKKVEIVLNEFIEIVKERKCKPNKLWDDQRKQF